MFDRLRPTLKPIKPLVDGQDLDDELDKARTKYILDWQYLFNHYRRGRASTETKKEKDAKKRNSPSKGKADKMSKTKKTKKNTALVISNSNVI